MDDTALKQGPERWKLWITGWQVQNYSMGTLLRFFRLRFEYLLENSSSNRRSKDWLDYRAGRNRRQDWLGGRISWGDSSCRQITSLCFSPWCSLQAPNNCRNVSAHITIQLRTWVALRLLEENSKSFKWLARLSTTESHSSLLCCYLVPTQACRPLHVWLLSMDVPCTIPCLTCPWVISVHPLWLWPEYSFLSEEEDFLLDYSRSLLVHHLSPLSGTGSVTVMFILSASGTLRMNAGMPEMSQSWYFEWNKANKAIKGKSTT